MGSRLGITFGFGGKLVLSIDLGGKLVLCRINCIRYLATNLAYLGAA